MAFVNAIIIVFAVQSFGSLVAATTVFFCEIERGRSAEIPHDPPRCILIFIRERGETKMANANCIDHVKHQSWTTDIVQDTSSQHVLDHQENLKPGDLEKNAGDRRSPKARGRAGGPVVPQADAIGYKNYVYPYCLPCLCLCCSIVPLSTTVEC
jgi:hypothetical protein